MPVRLGVAPSAAWWLRLGWTCFWLNWITDNVIWSGPLCKSEYAAGRKPPQSPVMNRKNAEKAARTVEDVTKLGFRIKNGRTLLRTRSAAFVFARLKAWQLER
jgi:hypothetical protein